MKYNEGKIPHLKLPLAVILALLEKRKRLLEPLGRSLPRGRHRRRGQVLHNVLALVYDVLLYGSLDLILLLVLINSIGIEVRSGSGSPDVVVVQD